MQAIKQILNAVFPFVITILLWRISTPVWNPCGILAMVPIFYYSFVRPRTEFLPMAILGTLLLDYNFDTMLFWTAAFCAAYAANFFQTFARSAVQLAGGLWAFAGFIGICLSVLGLWAFTFRSIGAALWAFTLSATVYWIWTRILKTNDR